VRYDFISIKKLEKMRKSALSKKNHWNIQKDWMSKIAAKNRQSMTVMYDHEGTNGLKLRVTMRQVKSRDPVPL